MLLRLFTFFFAATALLAAAHAQTEVPPYRDASLSVEVRVQDLLSRMTTQEKADRVGITLANLSILKTGKAKAIRFSTLDALCQALDCQPGDILEYEL